MKEAKKGRQAGRVKAYDELFEAGSSRRKELQLQMYKAAMSKKGKKK